MNSYCKEIKIIKELEIEKLEEVQNAKLISKYNTYILLKDCAIWYKQTWFELYRF